MPTDRPQWQTYTTDQRTEQLARLAAACRDAARIFADQGDESVAGDFARRAAEAVQLLREGWDRTQLVDLATGIEVPDWMNPKYADFNGPRHDWQNAAAEQISLAQSAAADLRAIAYAKQ